MSSTVNGMRIVQLRSLQGAKVWLLVPTPRLDYIRVGAAVVFVGTVPIATATATATIAVIVAISVFPSVPAIIRKLYYWSSW